MRVRSTCLVDAHGDDKLISGITTLLSFHLNVAADRLEVALLSMPYDRDSRSKTTLQDMASVGAKHTSNTYMPLWVKQPAGSEPVRVGQAQPSSSGHLPKTPGSNGVLDSTDVRRNIVVIAAGGIYGNDLSDRS
jgi:hypothetical protein